MSEQETQSDLIEFEERIRKKYSRLSLVIFFIGIIVFLWAVIVFLGIYIWGFSFDWAYLNFENWILVVCAIIFVLMLIEIIFYSRYSSLKRKKTIEEKPVEFIDGKKIQVFTFPKGVEGGIFSKTYIDIDGHNVLRLRTLMIPPGELWSKKE